MEAIMSEHEGPLLRYAARILGNSGMAGDAVEEVFIRFFRNRDWRVDVARGEASIWLYRTVHEIAAGRICSDRVTARGVPKAYSSQQRPAEKAMEAIRGLDLHEQQVIVLKVFEHKSNFEISRITGISETMVAASLSLYIMKVATELKKAGLL